MRGGNRGGRWRDDEPEGAGAVPPEHRTHKVGPEGRIPAILAGRLQGWERRAPMRSEAAPGKHRERDLPRSEHGGTLASRRSDSG